MKRIIVVLLLLLCLKSSGQNSFYKGVVGGTVTDSITLQPIQGAVVHLRGLKDSSYVKSLLTNVNGFFKFNNVPYGTYTIRIEHVGYLEYAKFQVTISDVTSQVTLSNIKLSFAEHKLNEVVISAGRKIYIEKKIDRTIVNVSQLISNNGVSAVEVLNNTPGIEVNDDNISLMGKQGVTIYIDGHQTYLTGTELVNYLQSLPSGSIEKLELMPIPPAKYHVEGSGGIINIITKKSHSNGFNGSLSASQAQGIYPKSNYSLNLNYKTGKLYFIGDASFSSNNNYFKVQRERTFTFALPVNNYSINQDNLETNNRKSTHYKFGLDAELNHSNTVGLIVDGLISPYVEHGNYFLQFNHTLPDSIINTNSGLNRNTSDVAINVYYQHKFKKNEGQLRVDADYLNYHDDAVQQLTSNTYLPNGATQIGQYNLFTENPFKANVYSLKSDYESTIRPGFKLSAGLQSIYSARSSKGIYFNKPGVTNDSLTSSNTYKEHINSAYVSLNKDIKQFTLEAGLRFENSISDAVQFNYSGIPSQQIHLTYNDFFPKLYASYKLDSAGSNMLNLAFDGHIERADYSSLNSFAFYFDRYTVVQGNAALQPSRIANLDFSYTHLGIFTVGATLSKGNNTIVQYYYVSGQSLFNTSINIHNSYFVQLYGNTTFGIFKWWTSNLLNTLTNRGYSGPAIGNQVLDNHALTYQLSGNNQFKLNHGWTAELSGSYRTKTTFGQGYYLPIWRLNASLQKKVLSGNGNITLSGADIFHSWKIRRDILISNAEIIIANSNDTQQAKLTFTYRFGSAGKSHTTKSGLETERNRAGVN